MKYLANSEPRPVRVAITDTAAFVANVDDIAAGIVKAGVPDVHAAPEGSPSRGSRSMERA